MRVSTKASGTGAAPKMGAGVPPATAGPVGQAVPTDALSVSSGAQFIAVAREHLAAIPDVRTDKVEALRAQLDSDTYNPDGEAVADGLVREHSPQHNQG